MKKVIYSSTSKRRSLDDLIEEEIDRLPERFTCVTRQPGSSSASPVFDIVSKSDFLKDPKKCFFIDNYWGYAFPHEIYIARPDEIKAAEDKEIEAIKSSYAKYNSAVAYRF